MMNFANAQKKTMGDCLAAKEAENIPLHPEVADLETGKKIPINPAKADPLVTQKWAFNMMQGKDSPLYPAFQPGAKGGKMEASEREVTFEELLMRSADKMQNFPIMVAMHLTKQQRQLEKLWEMEVCNERRATHLSLKNMNMLPDDIVEMKDLVVMALGGTDHHVEWQEYKPPAHAAEFPKKVLSLEPQHFEAMDTLTAGGVRQSLDDVSVAMADVEFDKGGHPYTAELCRRPEIKRNISQIKLDLKDGCIMHQERPVLTNPAGKVAFDKCMTVDSEFVDRVAQGAEQIMKEFGGHFTIEGSHQDKEGVFQNCDFQGCETNDWAEGVPAEICARAFVSMTKFLQSVKNESSVKDLVEELLATLETWEQQIAAM